MKYVRCDCDWCIQGRRPIPVTTYAVDSLFVGFSVIVVVFTFIYLGWHIVRAVVR